MNVKTRLAILLVICVIGLAASVVLEVVHVQAYMSASADSFCTAGEQLDCNAVALSRFAVVGNIPMPVWGMAGFVTLALAALERSRVLLGLTGFGALASIALLVEEIAGVGSVCMFCEVVHLCFVAAFIVSLTMREHLTLGLEPRALLRTFAPAGVTLALVAVVAPPYWQIPMWNDAPGVATGVTAEGRPWIGAESPELTVHEFTDYACPHCAIASGRSHLAVARAPDELRVVRHQYPRMRCPQGSGSRCLFVRAAMCAGDQGKFWQMDSWLFRHAGGLVELDLTPGVEAIGLDAAAFDACLDDPKTWARADRDAEEAEALGISGTPGYAIDGEVVEQGEVVSRIEAL